MRPARQRSGWRDDFRQRIETPHAETRSRRHACGCSTQPLACAQYIPRQGFEERTVISTACAKKRRNCIIWMCTDQQGDSVGDDKTRRLRPCLVCFIRPDTRLVNLTLGIGSIERHSVDAASCSVGRGHVRKRISSTAVVQLCCVFWRGFIRTSERGSRLLD